MKNFLELSRSYQQFRASRMRTKPSYQNYVFGQNMKQPAMVRPGIIASFAFTAYSWPSNILSTKDLIWVQIQKDHLKLHNTAMQMFSCHNHNQMNNN